MVAERLAKGIHFPVENVDPRLADAVPHGLMEVPCTIFPDHEALMLSHRAGRKDKLFRTSRQARGVEFHRSVESPG